MVQFTPMNNAVETEEGQSNPYNANKDWSEGTQNVKRGLQGANDSLAYATPKKTPVAISTPEGVQPLESPTGEATQVEESITEVTQDSDPYNKVDYKKRYDDLKKHYDNKLNQFKTEKEALEATITANKPKFVAPKTPEELATFREKYPDVFDVMESVAHLRNEEQSKALESRLKILEEREEKLATLEAEQELLKVHPDFKNIRSNEDFHSWAKEQPEAIQQWVYDNSEDVTLAARAIDLYKRDRGIPIESNQGEVSTNTEVQARVINDARGSAADAVSVSTASSGQPVDKAPKVWTQAEIAALSIHEYERLQPELDKAFSEGRIVA